MVRQPPTIASRTESWIIGFLTQGVHLEACWEETSIIINTATAYSGIVPTCINIKILAVPNIQKYGSVRTVSIFLHAGKCGFNFDQNHQFYTWEYRCITDFPVKKMWGQLWYKQSIFKTEARLSYFQFLHLISSQLHWWPLVVPIMRWAFSCPLPAYSVEPSHGNQRRPFSVSRHVVAYMYSKRPTMLTNTNTIR